MSFNPQEYIIKLKGKDYLEVKWRLVWFRDENNPKDPTSIAISTEIIQDDGEQGLVKAIAYDGNGRIIATGHKREHKREFHDYIEKAETGAIGRVLGALGYGTQFAEEFDLPEGKLVDTPVQFPDRSGSNQTARQAAASAPAPNARDVAKAKQEAAKANAPKAEAPRTPSTDTLPFDEQAAPSAPASAPAATDGEPINSNQIKAIGNMLDMMARKKSSFDKDAFKASIVSGFGKATIEELSFEQGKEVVALINAEMRKPQ